LSFLWSWRVASAFERRTYVASVWEQTSQEISCHKGKGKFVPVLKHYAMKAFGEWMYRSTFSWPRHLLEVSGQLHASAALPRERAPNIHCIGGWVDYRAGLEDEEKRKFLILPGLDLRPLGRPARNQSLYRLRYPGSKLSQKKWNGLKFKVVHNGVSKYSD
jgi:hypothetical protein